MGNSQSAWSDNPELGMQEYDEEFLLRENDFYYPDSQGIPLSSPFYPPAEPSAVEAGIQKLGSALQTVRNNSDLGNCRSPLHHTPTTQPRDSLIQQF